MKKTLIAGLIALSASMAQAVEIGVHVARSYAGTTDVNAGGITIGESFGKIGIEAGFTRATKGINDQDRYSLMGSYQVAKLGSIGVAAKVGGVYLDNQKLADGYALVAGVGVGLPINKQLMVGVDVLRQFGQDRVKATDGNMIVAGVKYRF